MILGIVRADWCVRMKESGGRGVQVWVMEVIMSICAQAACLCDCVCVCVCLLSLLTEWVDTNTE